MEPGTADETVIEAVLSSVEAQTRLVIEQRGLLLADLPGRGAGWQAHAEELAAYLSGRQPAPWRERWADLIPAYAALGPPRAAVDRGRDDLWPEGTRSAATWRPYQEGT
jgi:hypothetical protein